MMIVAYFRDASFPEIPNIPEYFHAQEASWIFKAFTSFQQKRKKTQKILDYCKVCMSQMAWPMSVPGCIKDI